MAARGRDEAGRWAHGHFPPQAMEVWMRRELQAVHGAVVSEPIPDELLALLPIV